MLNGYFVGATAAFLGLTFAVTVRSPVAVVLALALAGGALFPPLTAVVRVAWVSTWPDRDRRDAGLSLDTVIVELTSIAVPPATAVLVTGGRPWVGEGPVDMRSVDRG